jgi:hypothetical protein
MFWLSGEDAQYPCLAIRVSGDAADVHYFPKEGHRGFQCLGGERLPKDGYTTLVYEGSDPRDGEDTPNSFIVPVKTAHSIARVFLSSDQMSDAVSWFEL